MSVNRLEQARATLGISQSSTMEEARKAFRLMALQTRPEKNLDDQEANQRFLQVTNAWDLIEHCQNNDEEFQAYDEEDNCNALAEDGEGCDDESLDEAMYEMFEDIFMSELLNRMSFSIEGDQTKFQSKMRYNSRRGQRYGRNGGRSNTTSSRCDNEFSHVFGGEGVDNIISSEDDDIEFRRKYKRGRGYSKGNSSYVVPDSATEDSPNICKQTFAEAAQESFPNGKVRSSSKKKKCKKKGKKKR